MIQMRKKPEQRLEDLQQQQARLKARIAKTKAVISQQKRKDDTRRKIITGAIVLAHMEHDAAFKHTVEELLRRYLKDSDRELFDL